MPKPAAGVSRMGTGNNRSAGITERAAPGSAQLRCSFAPTPGWCSYSTRMSYFTPADSVIEIGGVGLQVVRDWVLKFNAHGCDGLIDRKARAYCVWLESRAGIPESGRF